MNNTEPVRLPLWKNAFDALRAPGATPALRYGELIPWAWLEAQLRCPHESPKFRRELIPLREATRKVGGFVLSESSTHGQGLRVLSVAEVAPFCRQQEVRKAKHSQLNALTLGAADTSTLTPTEKARHDHVQNQCATIAIASAALLRRRKLPPSPDTKQLAAAFVQ